MNTLTEVETVLVITFACCLIFIVAFVIGFVFGKADNKFNP